MSKKLTEEIANSIHAMRHAYDKDIATAIGIHATTLTRWKQKGELLKKKDASQLSERDQLFIRVHDSLVTAQVDMLNVCVNQIMKTVQEDGVWQAAAWWLERRYPSSSGRRWFSIRIS